MGISFKFLIFGGGFFLNTFLSDEELKNIGLKAYGKNVFISRNALIYSPETIIIGNNVRIDDFSILSGNIVLHDYIHVAQFSGLYGGDSLIEMFDYTSLSSKVSIYAVSDDYSGESMTNPMIPMEFKPKSICEKVILEKFVAVGASCVILPGVTLAEGSSFCAMSLVVKNTLPWTVYAGVPARRVSDRSKNMLELEKKFRNNP